MRALKALLYLPAALLLACVVAELGVRAVYAWARHRTVLFPVLYERVYWADLPPWVRSLSLFATDAELGLWMKPNLDRTYMNLYGPIGRLADVEPLFTGLVPAIPDWAASRPAWRLTTSSLGIRNDEIEATKRPETFRIAVLGDSWTVGVNLAAAETYPRRLAALLADAAPDAHVEVINYGAIGTGAETGRRLVARVLALDPDLLVVAYAQNDEAAVRDGTPAPPTTEPALPWRARLARTWTRVRAWSEAYNLAAWLRSRTPGAIEASLRRGMTRAKRLGDGEPEPPCPNRHATQTPYRRAIANIVKAARARHVDVVLLYNNVPDSPTHCTRAALAAVAAAQDVPLVDSAALLATAARALHADGERRRGLAPPPPPPTRSRLVTTVVVRVDMTGASGTPHVMGSLPNLANGQPNTTPLFDDGTHGDQIAGDGVWSRAVSVVGAQRFAYLFTNGDSAGTWTGLENYQPRVAAIGAADVGTTVYLPVAEFGRMPLRSDPAHPDAAGAALIADALARTIRGRPAWTAFMQRTAAS